MIKLSDAVPVIAETKTVTIVGDIMQHEKQLAAIAALPSMYYDTFIEIAHHLLESEWSIGNLETTVSENFKLSGFPKFNSPVKLLLALEMHGFNVMSLANNHTFDMGKLGLDDTRDNCIKYGIVPIGHLGKRTLLLEGTDVCIHTATTLSNNMNGSHLLEWLEPALFTPVPGKYNIAYIHGGREYRKDPTLTQRGQTAALWSMGIDMVVYTHSHMVGQIEQVGDNIAVWGMGNFLSDQEKLDRQQGRMLKLAFTGNKLRGINDIRTETVWAGYSNIITETGSEYIKV